MQIGFIGLGKMGSRMAGKLIAGGHDVIVWNRSPEPVAVLKEEIKDLQTSDSVQVLIETLQTPRIIWTMLPAGEATDAMLTQIAAYSAPGDIVINGANEHFKNTERHATLFAEKGVKFLGIGVSGGIIAAQEGYPLMVGGDKEAYEIVKPLLDTLSQPRGGHTYFGTGGAGHYVKMVHNAIEYGYMQAIGEGFDVLAQSDYHFDLVDIAKTYQRGTLISGFMMDRTVEALEKDPQLDHITGHIGSASGETVWTIEEAKEKGIPLEIIEASLEYRRRSATDDKIQASFTARMVAALRNAFGGHEVKKKE